MATRFSKISRSNTVDLRQGRGQRTEGNGAKEWTLDMPIFGDVVAHCRNAYADMHMVN
jgi:hypothetical protein